ncbi:hypothetical protein QBC35DRAFT_459770 [Podospora australis]|uniref:Uncharacterized protein n=1 Tax=Podospora australis TaxID=1536484 RepID=A0AAN7AMN1_9PEZI|nr:hypothetical protein QBC35DRAFT_459770 [Podospora australis]
MQPKKTKAKASAETEDEYDGTQKKLEKSAAARVRLEKAKQERDKKRAAVAQEYEESLANIQTRIEKSVQDYRDMHHKHHANRIARLEHLTKLREEKLHQIIKKVADYQQHVLNLVTQLDAVYQSRGEDVDTALKVLSPTAKAPAQHHGGDSSQKQGPAESQLVQTQCPVEKVLGTRNEETSERKMSMPAGVTALNLPEEQLARVAELIKQSRGGQEGSAQSGRLLAFVVPMD